MSKAFARWARCYRLWTFSVTRLIFYCVCTQRAGFGLEHFSQTSATQAGRSPSRFLCHPHVCPHFLAWAVPSLTPPWQSLSSYITVSLLALSASRPHRKVLWFCFVLVWGRVWCCCSGCPEMSGLRLSSCLSLCWGWDHRCVPLLSDNGKVFEGGLVLSHHLVKYL